MKGTDQRCAVVLIANGFEEAETVALLSLMRQAGLCIKSVGLVSGLIEGIRGLSIRPDLTLADLETLEHTISIIAVILPEGKPSLARLETDPRVHKLLKQVMARQGFVITSREGLRVVRAALWGNPAGNNSDELANAIIVRDPQAPFVSFVRDLVRRLQ